MSNLFKMPSPPPPPAPIPPPPMPDPMNPSALNEARQQGASRAGRASTVLSLANRGNRATFLEGMPGVPYAGATLGGGR